ncbi:MAG: thioredoxin [Succinatimonas sp.]|nr:thioredoxin [Succinatimonas sp.]HAH71347.1 thioredoxin [Succinivibrionaceae bacterium]
MSKVLHLNDSDFENEVINSDVPVLVDFWATWCGPCKMIAPSLDELSEEMPNVKFVKIDIDKNSGYAGQLGIMSIPTLLIYKNGEVVGKQVGAMPKDSIKNFIESFI